MLRLLIAHQKVAETCAIIFLIASELYLNGLNRPLFVPFIDLLKETSEVHRIQSPIDYRLSGTRVTEVYHTYVALGLTFSG